jgi:hypothetical protein
MREPSNVQLVHLCWVEVLCGPKRKFRCINAGSAGIDHVQLLVQLSVFFTLSYTQSGATLYYRLKDRPVRNLLPLHDETFVFNIHATAKNLMHL